MSENVCALCVFSTVRHNNPLLVDAILCDLVMPKVSSMEAIAYFRSQFRGVPILVLTGHATIENVGELYKQDVVECLLKPIGPEKLLAAVQKAVPKHHLFGSKGAPE